MDIRLEFIQFLSTAGPQERGVDEENHLDVVIDPTEGMRMNQKSKILEYLTNHVSTKTSRCTTTYGHFSHLLILWTEREEKDKGIRRVT